MNFEVEISYKANLDIRHIYEYYVMNNFDLNYVKHLINGIVSLIKSLEYLPERYPRFELLKKETNVRYAIYKKYKIKLLFCKWVVIIRLFTVLRAHCIPVSHFFWRQNCHFNKF